jgi:sugar/nucleoside kinase (ribokinase family)
VALPTLRHQFGVSAAAMNTLGPGDASWAMPGLMFVTGLLFGFSAGQAGVSRPGRVPPGVRGLGRRDGVRIGHRVAGQGRRRGLDDGRRLKLAR